MRKITRESLEFKYLIFVIALLIGGILWSGIISFSAVSLEKIYGRSFHSIMWTTIISIIGITAVAFIFWIVARKLVITPLQSIEKAARSLADGDLTFRLDIKADDEMGRTSKAMNESSRSLGDIFQRVKNGSKRVTAVAEKVEAEFKNVTENTKLETEAIANIASSLEEMNSAAAEISESTERLAVSTEEKAASMEEIVTSISQVANSAQELSQVVDTTSSSIEELSATIKEVAYKAEELAAASEETLAATEEISSSIKEVEQSAKESAMLSEKVKNEASTLGIASVGKTIEGIQNIKISFDKTANSIKKLGVRSDEIGKILNVIDEVTDQTTLLALNAAILAAQAGEHGKGFSVVADEIKDLAERTSYSTHEIAELIQAVQQEVKDAIFAMDEGLRSVEEGLSVANDAGDALSKIVESSKKSAEMSFSIERSTTEQAKTTRLVSDSMEKVKNMVSQIAKATLEQSKGTLLITKATEKMRDVSNHVRTATSEQLISTKHISEAMELASEKSLQIAKAINEQRAGASQIFSSIEKIKDIPKHNMDKMFGINQSLKGLFRNTELLTNELKKIKLPDEGSAGSADINLIRFGVEPVGGGSPLEIQEKFSPLAEHLSKKTGQKVVLKVVSDYEGILRDIEQGITQFCFVSPVTYIIAKKKYGTQVIAKALIEGKSAYRSVIVTKSASRINSLEDIRGRKFAFGDPHSLSSYIAPRKMLLNAGIDLKDLLHYEYLASHEAVADAVLSGNFDAGGITESAANKFKDKGIKFIQFSENLPGFIICVSKTIPQGMKESLEIALTALSDTRPESSAILHSIYKRYSGFEKAYDIEFAQLESMMSQLGLP
jgi:methyl-accepting chemotaxis protein